MQLMNLETTDGQTDFCVYVFSICIQRRQRRIYTIPQNSNSFTDKQKIHSFFQTTDDCKTRFTVIKAYKLLHPNLHPLTSDAISTRSRPCRHRREFADNSSRGVELWKEPLYARQLPIIGFRLAIRKRAIQLLRPYSTPYTCQSSPFREFRQ